MTKKVYFKTQDNLKLCGIWSIPNKKTNKAIILAHGLNADKDEGGVFIKLANALAGEGFSVFRFDFRGRGESEGTADDVSTKNEVVDLGAAFDFVRQSGYRTIGLLGASFGGASSTLYVADNPNKIRWLCLWSPGLNNRHVIIRIAILEFLKRTRGLKKGKVKNFKGKRNLIFGKKILKEMITITPYKHLSKIKIPTMIIHGNNDSKVPYKDSKKYVKLLEKGKLLTIKNGQHGFHGKRESKIAIEETMEFFKNYL